MLRSLLKEARLLAVRYLAVEAHRIAFPEMVEPSLKNVSRGGVSDYIYSNILSWNIIDLD